jgi:hypothetical protein
MASGSRPPATPTPWLPACRQGIENADHARLGWQSPANETFPIVSKALAADARRRKAPCSTNGRRHAPPPDLVWTRRETMLRLVTSFATTEDHVDQLCRPVWAEEADLKASQNRPLETTNTITTGLTAK